jgi:hypothetical protein
MKFRIIGSLVVLTVLVILYAVFAGGDDRGTSEEVPAGISN